MAVDADAVENLIVVVVAVGEAEVSFDGDGLIGSERKDVGPSEPVGVVPT